MANLSGCFLMGFLVVALGNFEGGQREMATAFLLTGFLGSLTTFSSFILEFFRLAQQNGPKLLVSHSVAHLAVGLLGLFLGHAVAQRLWQN